MIYLDNVLEKQDVYIPRQTQNTNASTRYITELELTESLAAETARTESTYAKKTDLSAYTPTSHFATVNGQKITEGGNIEIEGGGASYTGGQNINIDENNVISVTGITIPTDLSSFNNDVGFVTSDNVEGQINSAIAAETARTESTYLKEHQSLDNYYTSAQTETAISSAITGVKQEIRTEIPTKVSDLQNDLNFVNNTVNNLVNYYTKSETYTKSQINALIEAIPHFQILVVDELPVTGLSNTVYLVRNQEATGSDLYDEWIWVNNKWENLGTASVDLSQYYTSAQTETAIRIALTDYRTEAQIRELINTALAPYATTAFTESTYLKEHQSLSAYSTTQQVENMIDAATSGKADSSAVTQEIATALEDYTPTSALTIPTKTSDLVNDSGFITSADIPTSNTAFTNDAGYVTSGEVETQITGKGYATEQYVNGQIGSAIASETARTESTYLKSESLAPYSTTSEVEDLISSAITGVKTEIEAEIPANLSDLQNDLNFVNSGQVETQITSALTGYATTAFTESTYLKEHQSLANYYTKQEINQGILNIESQIAEKADSSAVTEQITQEIADALVDYATIQDIPTNLSELNNDMGFVDSGEVETQIQTALEGVATEQYVDDSVNTLVMGIASIGMVNDVTTSGRTVTIKKTGLEGGTPTTSTTSFDVVVPQDITDAVTSAIAAETARTESTYLKEHQSLSAYSTTEQVRTLINTAKQEVESEIPDVSDFVTSAQVETQITSKGYITNQALTSYTPTSNFATINGQKITEGGNIVIQGGGGSGGGETVIELTQAQYDALTGYAQDTTYIITDAPSVDLDNYYTSAQTESAITAQTSLKQDTLVSGTNIKTINNQSILGSGDIYISPGNYYYAGAGLNLLNGSTFEIKDYENLKQGARLGELEKIISIALNDLNNRLKNLE